MSTNANDPRPGLAEGREVELTTELAEPIVADPAVRLKAALYYAARGWPVFPCEPDGKAPLGTLVPHGVKNATTEPARITAWWTRRPDANVAIATGAPAVDVIDVDNKPDGDGFAAFNRLVRAGVLAGTLALVRTPSGGIHAYRTGTDQGCGRLGSHFIDFKARGGYVIAPPSTVQGRPYVLTEHRPTGTPVDWARIKRILDPPRPVRPAAPRAGHTPQGVAGLVSWLSGQREGNRNNALFWAACRAVESGAEGSDLDRLLNAALSIGLAEGPARATIRSAMRHKGVSA
ncbi:bifunctional DNA primase/polymerase [Nocardiopsis sp. L17-MgMaSL7]|uniref:bifunctional DNA primase/polymerase n=1 Tax=Nocardiopsis sp. L17-MgMaSL7 TaxID=1938893 RepID=UPI000D7185DD|nr:bifunctional DNA primase/polymerase [Nocardiopsis sp. L17-MgMaSL7]PWV49223.1 bifunctional DNA primase/polymerase-like protein [Nocardiopsis sp. L17-MgMaSL7]